MVFGKYYSYCAPYTDWQIIKIIKYDNDASDNWWFDEVYQLSKLPASAKLLRMKDVLRILQVNTRKRVFLKKSRVNE